MEEGKGGEKGKEKRGDLIASTSPQARALQKKATMSNETGILGHDHALGKKEGEEAISFSSPVGFQQKETELFSSPAPKIAAFACFKTRREEGGEKGEREKGRARDLLPFSSLPVTFT